MSQFKIIGQQKLHGKVNILGAKNAALKIIPAAILGNSASIISNVPDIIDIEKMIKILDSIGAKTEFSGNTVTIDPTKINSYKPDKELIKKLRGSIVLVGALLSKFGRAHFFQPGGCLIGARSIDDHLDIFEQLGVKIRVKDGEYDLSGYPKAGHIVLKKMSVTATENAILSTVLSNGITHIHAAAAEPEIADLANFLNKMGASVSGAGTHEITVTGVKTLTGANHQIIPDRIEAGTFLMLAIATNAELEIGPIVSNHLNVVLKRLDDAGAKFEIIAKDGEEFIRTKKHAGLISQNIDTRPYPGFPTDLQSPYAVLMTQAKGESHIFETMFEGRFAYLEELKLLGGNSLILNPHEFSISGPTILKATEISSQDIRGGAALVLAALIAEGTTIINDVEIVDRGYEKIDTKLRAIGARIERIN